MKIEHKVAPKVFQPVEIKLTFESEEEFEDFKNMCGYNNSVADVVASKSDRIGTALNKKQLRDHLSSIYLYMNGIKNES